jgi:membrane protease YdiL (CAAX protease family)
MSAIESLKTQPLHTEPVASRRHTAVLVGIFLLLTLIGIVSQQGAGSQIGSSSARPNMLPSYLTLMVMEWGLFYYVWRVGLRRAGVKARGIIGGRWSNWKDVLRDAVLALGLLAVWMLVEIALSRLLGASQAASVKSLLPRRAVEVALWIPLSISAGFCEEFVFRGYFQRQFEAFTHSRWIALVLQSALFGVSHGYQGGQACLKITVFGVLFGLLALWRKNLRPGMVAHALTDIIAGIF